MASKEKPLIPPVALSILTALSVAGIDYLMNNAMLHFPGDLSGF